LNEDVPAKDAPLRFSWAAATHAGLRRQSNEDSVSTRPDLGLFVVADGMGGHVAGEVASRQAVEALEQFIADTTKIDQHGTWPFPFEPALSVNANRLKAGIRVANRRLAATMESSEELRGMATTVSAILVAAAPAVIAHVGDSRVYLLRDGKLQRQTIDHSWVEEQVRAGALTPNAARQHPWRNVVTRALAGGEDPEVDVQELELAPGDRVLLCSDGLFSVVTDDRLREALAARTDLPSICRGLIEAANAGGGPDNITAVVIEVDAP
jgi:protein phosphatase